MRRIFQRTGPALLGLVVLAAGAWWVTRRDGLLPGGTGPAGAASAVPLTPAPVPQPRDGAPRPPTLPPDGLPEPVRRAVDAARLRVLAEPIAGNWGAYAMLLAAHHFDPDALACFDVALALDPTRARWWYGAAMVHYDHDTEAAVAALRETVKRSPDYAPAWYHLGKSLSVLGRPEEAGAALLKAVDLAPGEPEVVLASARLAVIRGDLPRARQLLEQAMSMPGAGADVGHELARVERRQGHATRAGELVESAKARPAKTKLLGDPWLDEMLRLNAAADGALEKAASLAKKGQHGAAAEFYRQAIREEPGNAKAHVQLGSCLIAQGQIDEARVLLEAATRRFPDEIEGWALLGIVHDREGRPDQAARSLEQAVMLKPDYAQAWYGLGMARKNLRQFPEAAVAFRRCASLQPQNGDAHFAHGLAMEQLGRVAEAEAAFRAAVQVAPARLQPRVLLAIALIRRGELAEARSHLEEARRLAPADPMVARAWSDWRSAAHEPPTAAPGPVVPD